MMNKFNRIHGNGIPKPEDAEKYDACVNDVFMYFKVERDRWVCKGPLASPWNTLIDCQGPPTCQQGKLGDIAMTPKGQMWVRDKEWEGPLDLTDQTPEVFKTHDLIVSGNIQLPTDGDYILVHNADGSVRGALTLVPWPIVSE